MKRSARFLLLVLVSATIAQVAPATATSGGSGDLQMYTATVSTAQAQQLRAEGFDIIDSRQVAEDQVEIEMVLSPVERRRLQGEGVSTEVWRDQAGRTVTQLAAAQESGGYNVYRSFDEAGGIRDELFALARKYKFVDKNVIGQSVQGRPIIALQVTKGADDLRMGKRPGTLYTSTIHAREWISTEVNRRLLHWYIDRFRSGNNRIVKLLSKIELVFVVVNNPDGYQYSFEQERLWRKNLRDNNTNNQIDPLDGVDLNRNFPEHWGYDEEGSSSLFSSETYRGPSPASEPEVQAIIDLMNRGKFKTHITYHSYGNLILYPQGWQVQTPTADDPIYVALSGTDANPAIEGYDPDLSAELYITNGDQTDYADGVENMLAWTVELGEGNPAGGFVFPDDEAQIQHEFEINLPFALDVAKAVLDPDDPPKRNGIDTQPFYFDLSEIDPYKDEIPGADMTFPYSYGDPQPVQVIAKRSLKKVRFRWKVNGGPAKSGRAREWGGGERVDAYDTYYHYLRGMVTGTSPGDSVEVWFTGKTRRDAAARTVSSPRFTYQAVEESDARILIMSAEDYTGATPTQDPNGPHYLSYYTDALDAAGYEYDVYDVDARGRQAPDHLGVLSHYDAVIWYMGDDFLTRDADQPPGTGTARLANDEVNHVRAYLNEGGKLLYTGQDAGNQYASAFDYRPLGEPPYCDNVDQTVDDDCLALSDDFLQYYLGAYIYISDGGTDPDGNPYPAKGVDTPYRGMNLTFNGDNSAQNQVHTASLLTTSSILKPDQYPQFRSHAPLRWETGVTGAYEPHSGQHYMYSDRADVSYKRMTRTVQVPSGGATLNFWTSYDTEIDWDYFFVEAHTVGQDDWQTLPDENGHTGTDTGLSCPEGWVDELHPHLAHYQTYVEGDPSTSDDNTCTPNGTSGTWNAATGNSGGWQEWEVDLSPFAGKEIELSLSYVSDWATQGLGVWVDDVSLSTGPSTSFETDLGGWSVTGAPEGSDPNANDWRRTESVGYEEGAATATEDTLFFGFGFEGVNGPIYRRDLMARSMEYLLP